VITSTHGKEMMNNSPRYYQTSRVFRAHIEAKGIELDNLDAIMNDIEAQFSASTATWGLRYWEEMCGLPVNEQEPLENRRARVLAKIRSNPSGRSQDIQNIIQPFAEGQVSLMQHYSEYLVYIDFPVGHVLIKDLIAMVNEIMPAHLVSQYRAWGGKSTLLFATCTPKQFLFPYRLCGTFNASDDERWSGRLLRLWVGVRPQLYYGTVPYQLCGTFYAGGEPV